VCSFVPRPFDFHPDAVKVPYHHANVDSDEVLFYAEGDFMSRAGSGIGRGSISLHPAGFVHGPQPGSWERSRDVTRTEEVAVMLDTFRPLLVSDAARAVADPAYFRSWVSDA
jgi:homogentisate 1,2-dioxygenase